KFAPFTAILMYFYHTFVFIFLSSFATLRLGVRLENVVYLPKNHCKTLKKRFPFFLFHAMKSLCG
ncbi:MAG: hypothetical protein ACKPGB_21005, partial [Dolichospermum sp.]